MLTFQNTQLNSIFERIVRNKDGVLVRLRFVVVEVNGALRGQIVSIEPLAVEAIQKQKTVCLSSAKKNKVISQKSFVSFAPVFSPYVFLEFFMSQSPRAPSFFI